MIDQTYVAKLRTRDLHAVAHAIAWEGKVKCVHQVASDIADVIYFAPQKPGYNGGPALSFKLVGDIVHIGYDSGLYDVRVALLRHELLREAAITYGTNDSSFLELARIAGAEAIAGIPPINVPPPEPGFR